MMKRKMLYFSLAVLSLASCKAPRLTLTTANNAAIAYHGRTQLNSENQVDLITSAAFAEFQFAGKTCTISLSNYAASDDYNYVVMELDNVYKGRVKVSSSTPTPFTITADNKNEWHQLRIYKATESQNGVVSVANVRASKLKSVPFVPLARIEFIGNSITCGMGNDTKEIPCGNGSKWYDQHNAYWSYATLVARELNADFMLSSISGSGIYRNWNSDSPTVPQQYESAYLRMDSTQKWDFSHYTPDIVSIALGTNDLSTGDGTKPRLPFDSTRFVHTYIDFI